MVRPRCEKHRTLRLALSVSLVSLAFAPAFLAALLLSSRWQTLREPSVADSFIVEERKRRLQSPPLPSLAATSKLSHYPHEGLMTCDNLEEGPCCAPWAIDTDEWWMSHPDWHVSQEDETHHCYSKIADQEQAKFLRRVHNVQWNTDCDHEHVQREQISSGYATALIAMAHSFYASYEQGKSFQMTKHHEDGFWNFSQRRNSSSHWAYCESRDMTCYFVPLSHCEAEIGRDDAPQGSKPTSYQQKKELRWLRQYAFRLRHKVRRHLFDYVAAAATAPAKACTAIHVRRGDTAFGEDSRRTAIHEYLRAGNIEKGEIVVLLTDDATVIEEVQQYYGQLYQWVYLDRPRFRGPSAGFENYLPSGDPTSEVLATLAEVRLVGRCKKLVHTKSSFIELILDEMNSQDHAFQAIYLDPDTERNTRTNGP